MICDYNISNRQCSSTIMDSCDSSMRVSPSESSLDSASNSSYVKDSTLQHKPPCNSDANTYHQELRVPADYPSLQAAVSHANQEFARAAAQQLRDVTITIHLDPRDVHRVDQPLAVHAAGENYHLILQALPQTTLTNTGRPEQEAAQISLDTSLPNLPLLRLVSGHLRLQHLRLEHFSQVDITVLTNTKSSNAALVVEEPLSEWQSRSISLQLEHVTITSYSGRGIMNRAQCPVEMNDCYVAKLW